MSSILLYYCGCGRCCKRSRSLRCNSSLHDQNKPIPWLYSDEPILAKSTSMGLSCQYNTSPHNNLLAPPIQGTQQFALTTTPLHHYWPQCHTTESIPGARMCSMVNLSWTGWQNECFDEKQEEEQSNINKRELRRFSKVWYRVKNLVHHMSVHARLVWDINSIFRAPHTCSQNETNDWNKGFTRHRQILDSTDKDMSYLSSIPMHPKNSAWLITRTRAPSIGADEPFQIRIILWAHQQQIIFWITWIILEVGVPKVW